MTAQKIPIYFILTGLFLTLFIPLIVSSSLFFPFITGKNFAFRIMVEIIFGFWLWLTLIGPEYRPRKNLLNVLLGGLLLVLVLATFLAVNPSKAFWSNYERMEGLIGFFHLFAFFLVISSVLKTEKVWFWFWHTSIAVSVISAIYGLVQLAGKAEIHQGNVRLDATFGNASYLAVYMLIHVFLTACWLVKYLRRGKTNTWWWVYALAMFLQTFTLYHTATRGSILGFIGGALLTSLLILWQEKSWKTARRGAIYAFVALALIIGGFLAARQSAWLNKSPVLSRLASISSDEKTTRSRFMVWGMSWQGVKEHPLLGWGPDNYLYIFSQYYNPQMYDQEQWFDRSHNVFLDWATSTGLLGLGFYLALFVCALYYLWWRSSEGVVEKSLLTGLLAGYFFHNIFVFDQLTSYILFFAILAFINSRVTLEDKGNPLIKTKGSPWVGKPWLAVPIVIFILLTQYFVNLKPIRASWYLIDAIRPTQSIGYRDNLPSFQKVFALHTFGSREAREQLASITSTVVNDKNYSAEVKKSFADLARVEWGKQIAADPQDARSRVIYGSLLGVLGDPAAEAELKEAVRLSPKKQTIMFELGRYYWQTNRLPEAVKVFRQAFELAPTFEEARKLYALVLIQSRQIKEADKILLEGFGTTAVNDDRFINIYADAKLFDRVLKIWQAKVAATPTDIQPYLSLAATHLALGQRAQSIAVLERVAQLFPDAKTQVDLYIKDIRAGRNPGA